MRTNAGVGRVTIRLSGAPDRVYAIEASADLVAWQQVHSVSSGSGLVTFELPMGDAATQFFRAK